MSAELQRALFADVEAGLRVLVVRDGVPLTDEQISERTTNIVAALVGNYSIVPFEPLGAPPNWDTPLIASAKALRPTGHSWSCRCDPCDTYRRSVHP